MIYPAPDPVLLSLGPLQIHWYGIMYLVGFAGGYWLLARRVRRPGSGWTLPQWGDLLFYIALGVVLGGRVGYMLFYGTELLLDNPLSLFKIWQGGMSFHGGLLGVLLAIWLYARGQGRNFWDVVDFIAPVVPIGLGAGRLGNFINGELWGKVTTLPWGMRLPCADPRFDFYCNGAMTGYSLPHHPSMLYEMLLEGVVMFFVLWWFSARPRPRMAVAGLFALLYGVFRFGVEFVRLPDAHIGYLAGGWLTMGQVLSLPLIAVGLALLFFAYRRNAIQL